MQKISVAEARRPESVGREITLQGNISGLWQHFEMAIELMSKGRIETNFLIKKYALGDALTALDDASDRKVLKDVSHVEAWDPIEVQLHAGKIYAQVQRTEI